MDNNLAQELDKLIGWEYAENYLIREITVSDFSSAMALVVRVGIEAEKADHHPDILIHSYNKVIIKCSTHSTGDVSIKDVELARAIDGLI